MALQDLTPQLRTRLNRMERAVGWFVLLATALLAFGFGYYIYSTAERKGWFKLKATYYTYADSGAGLKVGDTVLLMGFPAGNITEITPNPPWGSKYNVYIKFEISEPNFGYLWTGGSVAKVDAAGLLGARQLEVTKGTNGHATYLQNPYHEMSVDEAGSLSHLDKWRMGEEIYDASGTNLLIKAWAPLTADLLKRISGMGKSSIRVVDSSEKRKTITAVWNDQHGYFEPFHRTNLYYLPPEEEKALTERAQALLTEVETALPNFLRVTNDLYNVLSNSARLTANLNAVAEDMHPAVTNMVLITEHLKDPNGSLGQWLFPTNVNQELAATLANANLTLTNADTNMLALAESLQRSLDNLASITSNLNMQVEANSNMLAEISDVVVHSDQFVQGLKRHWLLRSAFKTPATNAPPVKGKRVLMSPKAAAEAGP